MRHPGADLDRIAAIVDRVERGDARNVDQGRGLDDPQIEHRNERLSAGKNAGVVAVFGEQCECLLGRVGTQIIERARLHARALPSKA